MLVVSPTHRRQLKTILELFARAHHHRAARHHGTNTYNYYYDGILLGRVTCTSKTKHTQGEIRVLNTLNNDHLVTLDHSIFDTRPLHFSGLDPLLVKWEECIV